MSNGYAGAAVGLLRGFESVVEEPLAANALTDAAIGMLDASFSLRGPGPFFLYVHYRDSHEPTYPPESYRSLFSAEDGEPHTPEHARWEHGDAEDPDDPRVRAFRSHKRALYDGALRYVDDQVRRLAARLRDADVFEDTVFVVASDHGEEFWEHARSGRRLHLDPRGIAGIGHSHTLFAELLDVPLVVSGAGLSAQRVDSQVRNLDVLPTLLGLAGIATDGLEIRGVDLLSAIRSGELEPLPAISEDIAYGAAARSFDDGRYKLVRYEATRDGRRELLFDRSADPGERRDLLVDRPEVADRLREALRVGAPAPSRGVGIAVEFDDATREGLRALGYAP